VKQTRRLRDGRQLAEITCPHCDSTHWLLDPGSMTYCLSLPNKPMFVDGLGSPV
jgi:hypothetical protein